MTHPVGTRFARFAVERLMIITPVSEVYLVYDEIKSIERRRKYSAVLKISIPDPHRMNLIAMQNEVSVLQSLKHPCIVQIYPLGEYNRRMRYVLYQTEESSYFVMEYIRGGSVADHLDTLLNRPFDLRWRVELFYQIVTTVHYVHQKGYAHLDLKLENFILRVPPAPNRTPLPVLIDFGSASFRDELSNVNRLPGRNAAPELLDILRNPQRLNTIPFVASSCDIWSLGAILYELLTGYSIGWAGNPNYPNAPYTISHLNPEVPTNFDRLFKRLTDPNPERRLSTDNILEALQDIIPHTLPPRIRPS